MCFKKTTEKYLKISKISKINTILGAYVQINKNEIDTFKRFLNNNFAKRIQVIGTRNYIVKRFNPFHKFINTIRSFLYSSKLGLLIKPLGNFFSDKHLTAHYKFTTKVLK